ncbi:MAG TPA: hypothetical protein VEK08_18770 [Planctomycetota bacterium]|nr:hypothetical protein [Planctomycetota bacterium]
MKKFALVLAVMFVSCVSLRAQNVDDEGFIRDWLLLAPVPLEDGTTGADGIDKDLVKDEAKLAPKEGDKLKVGAKEETWKKVNLKDYFFDVNEIYGKADEKIENSAAYAVAYIVADDDIKDVVVQMGSNDQGKVYLNGKEVVKFAETRTLEKDQDKSNPLTLSKGTNTIVFKVINEMNNFQGCLRFTDKNGKGVKNIKVKLAP